MTGLVGVNSKCGVQSKRSELSCILEFPSKCQFEFCPSTFLVLLCLDLVVTAQRATKLDTGVTIILLKRLENIV